MWRVARVSSVRLRVPAAPVATTHESGRWCDQNAWKRRLLRPKRMGARVVFGAFLRSGGYWPKRKKAAGSAAADMRFGDFGGALVRLGDPTVTLTPL